VVDESTVSEESKVPKGKDFRSSFLLLWDFEVLAQTHGKEEGKNCELQDFALLLRELSLGNFGNDAGRDGFLLLFLRVFVFEDTK
jgi:hypothetical protein